MQTEFSLILLTAESDVARRWFLIRKSSIAWHCSNATSFAMRTMISNVCFAAAQTHSFRNQSGLRSLQRP